MNLTGKVILITGGAKRLGKAISTALARKGAKVVIHYNRSKEEAEDTLKEIKKEGGEGTLVRADLLNVEEVDGIIEKVADRYDHVDILVNNAAIFEDGNFADTTPENWDRHFAINLKAPFLISQSFAKQVKEGELGKIINITDWRGLRPGVGHFAYTITKSALITMTKSMAKILAPQITVNSIALGAILPPEGAQDDHFKQKIRGIPLKKTGDPSDVVAALLFLLEGSDFVTGTTVLVDGGESL